MGMLFRPIDMADLDNVYELAMSAGFGLTTLPKNKDELKKRTELSITSFNKPVDKPICENYFFVLEDTDTQKVVGTSSIEASVGYNLPFYSYRMSNTSKICRALNIRVEFQVLMLNNDLQGMSEIGTLFLAPDYRKGNNGLLLSLARFMFMGLFQSRFSDFVIAEMRGVSDENGTSPFWESLGSHFFPISFVKADELSVLTDKQFISDLMPHYPIYTNLLSKEAQAVIGKPHQSTMPAMRILEREGFYFRGQVDIFDAGPAIMAQLKNIRTIKKSSTCQVVDILDEPKGGSQYFISNVNLDFRATKATVVRTQEGCLLSKENAALLGVDVGDEVCLLALKKEGE